MGGPFKIAACQTPDIRGDIDASLQCIETHAAQAASAGASLLCFPECFLQGYLLDPATARRHALELGSPSFAAILARLSEIEPALVVGLIEQAAGRLYNTAAVIHRGRLLGRYRKRHLLAAEALFFPGDSHPVFVHNGLTFGINICADTRFPEASAALAARHARVVVCPANNMLPLDAAERWKELHNQVRCQRAREAKVWFVSADVTGARDGHIGLGPTAIIRPDGEIVAQVPLHQTGLVVAEIA